ncbi:TPA: hypothetical protein UL761_000277 [Stenotrophomonas maltophilia]|nr:hypothetical protein [Stenotrophomonas maltophilia]
MSRGAWITWGVAVALIVIGLGLVDHARAASVMFICIALVLMVAVMAWDTPKCPSGTAKHRLHPPCSTPMVSRREM